MPRMRTWNDVTFYRVDHATTYTHIDALFTQVVDWEEIERHWYDMMQVMLSIQAGTVLPSMLLQKLGVYSRQSSLYKAFVSFRSARVLLSRRSATAGEPREGVAPKRPFCHATRLPVCEV